MKRPTFNTLLVGGGFLLGTAGIKLLASAPVKNACVQGIACGMLPSSTSWRTASLRPSKGVAPSSVPRTLTDTDLAAIVRLRHMSQGLVDRLTSSYSKVMLTNSALLALGSTGAIASQASSLLHNGSTIAYSPSNAKAYLR